MIWKGNHTKAKAPSLQKCQMSLTLLKALVGFLGRSAAAWHEWKSSQKGPMGTHSLLRAQSRHMEENPTVCQPQMDEWFSFG